MEVFAGKRVTVTNRFDLIYHAMPFKQLLVIAFGGILDRKSKAFTVIEDEDVRKKIILIKLFCTRYFIPRRGVFLLKKSI